MRSVPIVEVCPDGEIGGAVVGCLVSARVGPFSQGGLDEPLGLAVGARRVGFGADVPEAQFGTGRLEGVRFVASAVVRENTDDLDPHRRVPSHGSLQMRDGTDGPLVGVDLCEGEA